MQSVRSVSLWFAIHALHVFLFCVFFFFVARFVSPLLLFFGALCATTLSSDTSSFEAYLRRSDVMTLIHSVVDYLQMRQNDQKKKKKKTCAKRESNENAFSYMCMCALAPTCHHISFFTRSFRIFEFSTKWLKCIKTLHYIHRCLCRCPLLPFLCATSTEKNNPRDIGTTNRIDKI